jgi:hypothetical protein
MLVDDFLRHCPKCDNQLDKQTDGSTVTVDIAHQGERVRDALQKLSQELNAAKSGVARNLRVIVGTGVIREEVMYQLQDLEFRGAIVRFDIEGANGGAILVRLK